MQKNNVTMKRKNIHSYFSFCCLQVIFHSQYPFFHLDLSMILPLLVKLEVLVPTCRGNSHVPGRQCLPFYIENSVFARWFLQGNLLLLMVSRVGYQVCVCSPYQCTLITISFYWILKLQVPLRVPSHFCIQERGFVICQYLNTVLICRREDVLPFVHISTVNCNCWLPAALPTVWWTSFNRSLATYKFKPLEEDIILC